VSNLLSHIYAHVFIYLYIYAVLKDSVKYAGKVNYAAVHAVENGFMNFTRIRFIQQY